MHQLTQAQIDDIVLEKRQAVLAAYVKLAEKHGTRYEYVAAIDEIYPAQVESHHIIAALEQLTAGDKKPSVEDLILACKKVRDEARRKKLEAKQPSFNAIRQDEISNAIKELAIDFVVSRTVRESDDALNERDKKFGALVAKTVSELIQSGDKDVLYACSQFTDDVKSANFYGQVFDTYKKWKDGNLPKAPAQKTYNHLKKGHPK